MRLLLLLSGNSKVLMNWVAKFRKVKSIFLALLFSLSVSGEPFLSPQNPFLRHEIRLLQDERIISSCLNTWPYDLGNFYGRNFETSWKHDLLGDTLGKENQLGLNSLKSSVGISDNKTTARSFFNKPRGRFNSQVETSWMSDRFAAKLSLLALYGVENDWKGRKDDGIELDGSYISVRLGNWSTTFGQVDRWWGPGWDGSLILSTNARPIPAISFDRRIKEPFESKWFSWIGPWSVHSFIGRLEKERTIPSPYLWGMRGEFSPSILDGLEIGFFRMIQLGGEGRPSGFNTWMDAFLSQDNYGANTGRNNRLLEPGNQLAGIDLRWKVFDAPLALYGQVVGEDEDKFFPNSLMFQYGVENWGEWNDHSYRLFAEYTDLTSYWWTDYHLTRNVTYGHHIYTDGYRFHGRPIGHWADQDSQILSLGGLLLSENGNGWGTTIRNGKLNEDGTGSNSVSNGYSSDYFSFEILNFRSFSRYDFETQVALGWEEIKKDSLLKSEKGLTFNVSFTKLF